MLVALVLRRINITHCIEVGLNKKENKHRLLFVPTEPRRSHQSLAITSPHKRRENFYSPSPRNVAQLSETSSDVPPARQSTKKRGRARSLRSDLCSLFLLRFQPVNGALLHHAVDLALRTAALGARIKRPTSSVLQQRKKKLSVKFSTEQLQIACRLAKITSMTGRHLLTEARTTWKTYPPGAGAGERFEGGLSPPDAVRPVRWKGAGPHADGGVVRPARAVGARVRSEHDSGRQHLLAQLAASLARHLFADWAARSWTSRQ